MSNVYRIAKKSKLPYLVIAMALFFSLLLFLFPQKSYAFEGSNIKSFIYFTGIGCPHCAKVAPVLHQKVDNQEGLVLIEYELYKESSNSQVLTAYSSLYNYKLLIPLILYDTPTSDQGDSPILNNLDKQIALVSKDKIQLLNKNVTWDDLNINDFEGKPKIFTQNRVAVKNGTADITSEENKLVKDFLLTSSLDDYVKTLTGTKIDNLTVEYSGGDEVYTHGVNIGSWSLYWRGNSDANIVAGNTTNDKSTNSEVTKISWVKVITLSLTDSINPCALSVLLMMLIAIATYHPKDKKQILWAGLAFVAAVFVTYFVYGLLIVKAFEVIQAISSIKEYLYKGLGIAAIVLGLLELKDFFFYKPGSIATEMPMAFRPKVQRIISKITSPLGAFGLGMFVTLFLLPCTIGPYVILGGMLSYGQFAGALPYLTVYNLVFILPMVVIILLVFFGSKNIKQVTEWREKNVKVMHLIIGLIFILLGMSMLLGIF